MKRKLINNIILILLIFSFGYIVNDIIRELIFINSNINTLNNTDLDIIKRVIEKCKIENGYIGDYNHIYGQNLNC